ncbi:hypothetical protein KXW57_004200 [Aspergillus fumigatus]|nr:hypothetical protein KXV98_002851 [Aspergillus fumigatus]KAH3242904.1 hypothetical protein KXW57_004200 [Aspergillus fumigatus]KAH3285544.1 hypothetical protein KXV19_003876 [Aspergillus fumigatus]KAJ8228121.1 hypothetical protein LV160_008918 [Aspergillus fumigatus]
MGNGAKAASKRERKAKDTKSTATSQLKANEAAKDIICLTCRQTFLKTTRAPALMEHASNKHNKTLQDCFPGFVDAPKK